MRPRGESWSHIEREIERETKPSLVLPETLLPAHL